MWCNYHCAKNIYIRSYSGPYFPSFGLNTERYSVSLRIQSECGKIWTRITPNTDTFYAVYFSYLHKNVAEAYSEPSRTSKMQLFAKIVNGFQPLIIFAKSFILDVQLGFEYVSESDIHGERFVRYNEIVS